MASSVKRTNQLKKLIQTKVKTLTTDVYFEVAKDNALYPHIVFDFSQVNLGDLSREDFRLDVHVWDKGTSTTAIDDLCDSVEDLFDALNDPQTDILPTFYKELRTTIEDEDKKIRHRVIRFQVQNYETTKGR